MRRGRGREEGGGVRGERGWRAGGGREGGAAARRAAAPARLMGQTWESPEPPLLAGGHLVRLELCVEGLPEASPNLGTLSAPEGGERRGPPTRPSVHPSLLTWMEFRPRECYRWGN